jgi:hypothetical protein
MIMAPEGAGQAAVMPERTRHLGFGDLAAAWGLMQRVGMAAVIDEVTAGGHLPGAGASVGTHLAAPGRPGPGRHPVRRVPLVAHAYPGDRPDVTRFATVVDHLVARHVGAGRLTPAPTRRAIQRPG